VEQYGRMIRVQAEPFDTAAELAKLKQGRTDIGGTVIFVGTMRDLSDGAPISAMTLEHYPGMTEKALSEIDMEAHRRWPLLDTLIVHRYGTLAPGDDIVLVIATSSHREAAFEACYFLIDWLKTKAPFWEMEEGPQGENWVAAKSSDDESAARWDKTPS
jgi:molybdopterin synthase catalytic subunit